ncbi:MAG: ThuA domain-containing protein, partial [Caldiserica bacterium]|nr:ThuA domain-containing protein [Caldisericota bacterium]
MSAGQKVLFITGGGFHPFDACAKILKDFLESYCVYEIVVTSKRDSLKNLEGYTAVIVYTQGGELNPEQERGLCEFVRRGGGFIGIHCASDSWVKNDEYMEMIGSHFIGHGPVTEFTVKISEVDSDITRRIFDFEITDEFYLL